MSPYLFLSMKCLLLSSFHHIIDYSLDLIVPRLIIAQPQRPIGRQLLAYHDDGPQKWAANATTGTIPLDVSDVCSHGQSMSGTVSDAG